MRKTPAYTHIMGAVTEWYINRHLTNFGKCLQGTRNFR